MTPLGHLLKAARRVDIPCGEYTPHVVATLGPRAMALHHALNARCVFTLRFHLKVLHGQNKQQNNTSGDDIPVHLHLHSLYTVFFVKSDLRIVNQNSVLTKL